MMTKEELKREKIMDECRTNLHFDDWFNDCKRSLEQEYIEENNDDFMQFVKQRYNEGY